MNIKNWQYLYKVDNFGRKCVTQHTYEPIIDLEQKILCLNFSQTNNYSKKTLKNKTCEFFFSREHSALEKFQDREWCPKIYDIDYKKRKIFIEFSSNFLNPLVCNNSKLSEHFQKKVLEILKDLYKVNKGKISIHSHCFFLSSKNELKTIDFFSSFDFLDPNVDSDIIDDILSDDSKKQFKKEPFFNEKEYNLLEIYKFLLKNDTWGNRKFNCTLENLKE
jgi:hypothetical protein